MSLSATFRLDDKVAIVTGGSKGLGRGLAEALAAAGAHVVVCSRNVDEGQAVADSLKQMGVDSLAFRVDVKEKDQVQAMVDGVMEHFGRIDILVNNAGVVVAKHVVDLTEDDWDYVLDINLKGTFLCSQAVGKVMIQQGGGRIINMGSILGRVADVALAAYCASKGGVKMLTKAMAAEWARYNINVNAIAPSYVETDLNRDALSDERVLNRIIRRTPMRRLGTNDDITGACLYLASDAAKFVTGQVIYVDGGWTAV